MRAIERGEEAGGKHRLADPGVGVTAIHEAVDVF